MMTCLQASRNGDRIGFIAASNGREHVLLSVAPKMWRDQPTTHYTLPPASGGVDQVALYEQSTVSFDPATPVGSLLHSALIAGADRKNTLIEPAIAHPSWDTIAIPPPTTPAGGVEVLLLLDRLQLLHDLIEEIPVHLSSNPLLRPLLARRFLDELAGLVHARRRGYESRTEDRVTIRGRVDMLSAAQVGAGHSTRVRCTYDQLTTATPALRIIAAAVDHLLSGSVAASQFTGRYATQALQRDAVLLRRVLADIPAFSPWAALAAGARLRLNRLDQPWQTAIGLGLALLQGSAAPLGSSAQIQTVEISVPTHRVWERIVTHAATHSGEFDQVSTPGSHPVRALYPPWRGLTTRAQPDNLATDRTHTWILDAKYKEFTQAPSRDDQYQLFAYTHLVHLPTKPVRDALLIYPDTTGAAATWSRSDQAPAGVRLTACGIPFPTTHQARSTPAWNGYLTQATQTLRGHVRRLKPQEAVLASVPPLEL